MTVSRNGLLSIGGVLVLAGLMTVSSRPIQGGDDDDERWNSESRIRQGFKLAPVNLNLRGKNKALVGYGSYLVNAIGGCSDCHTSPSYAPGGDPHLGQPEVINAAGYLAGGQCFGPFKSRNLTPDATGKPGGMSLSDFILIIRTGVDDDKVPPNVPSAANDLLQVMPWPVYKNMTDRDLKAIYEYLSAIPHVDTPTNSCP